MTTTNTTTQVLDPTADDGSTITVDLSDPPAWLDLDALRTEAGQAGDLELVATIDRARSGRFTSLTRSDFDDAFGASGPGITETVENGRRWVLDPAAVFAAYLSGELDGPDIVKEDDGDLDPDTDAGLWVGRAILSAGPWWVEVPYEVDEDDE